MDIDFVIKRPDRAYLGTQLWLPKAHVNTHAIKASLEFEVFGDEGREFLYLWEDTPHHLVVPREFVPREDYDTLTFPIIDITPKEFPRAQFESNVELDKLDPKKDMQKRAFAAFVDAENGLLNLACGHGKTTLALHAIAHLGYNALVIVNQQTILDQWEKSIRRFLRFDGEIGRIQKSPDKWDWRHPVTIAMLHSLARYPDAVTPDMRRWFGTVVWDEVHHLSAPYFCITAPMFPGHRYGLTATVSREDGTEVVFLYHLGEVFYKDLMQEVQPRIIFRETPFVIPGDDWQDILDVRGNPNISKLRTYVGQMEERNAYIQHDIMAALEKGRKVLALGHTHVHINRMYERFKAAGVDVGVCTGKQKVAARWAALRDKQLILGMHDLVKEAIDEDTLDTMVWMTPFGSQHPEGGKNALQQGMGRIQGYRYHEGMKEPMVLVFDDIYIRHFHRMCNVLRKQLRRWPEDEGGPYKFENRKSHKGAA